MVQVQEIVPAQTERTIDKQENRTSLFVPFFLFSCGHCLLGVVPFTFFLLRETKKSFWGHSESVVDTFASLKQLST